MPENIKQKALFMILNLIGTLAVGFLLLSTTARGEKWLSAEKAIDKKADIEYVNAHDAIIQKNLDDYKEYHQIQHTNEYFLMKAEVEIVKSNQEIMMTFWGIPKGTDN